MGAITRTWRLVISAADLYKIYATELGQDLDSLQRVLLLWVENVETQISGRLCDATPP